MRPLEEQLKILKTIEPDPGYSERSRHLVLVSRPMEQRSGIITFFLNSLQYGTSMALATLLMFLIVGGFGIAKLLSPLELSSIDAKSLRAEAQAIDIQLQLSNLTYNDVNLGVNSTAAAPSVPHTSEAAPKEEVQKKAEELGLAATSQSSTESVNIDEALNQLSE